MSHDSELFDVASAYFDELGIEPKVVISAKGLVGLRIALPGENGLFSGVILPDEGAREVAVFALAPFSVPEAGRRDVAELLVRINFDLDLGRFDMDFSDGEIRFLTAIDVTASTLSPQQVHVMLMTCLTALDAHLPTIVEVGANGVAPEKALADVARLP